MKKSIVLIPLPSLIKNSFVRSFSSQFFLCVWGGEAIVYRLTAPIGTPRAFSSDGYCRFFSSSFLQPRLLQIKEEHDVIVL